MIGFNSTIVRLKESQADEHRPDRQRFNSTMVRLKGGVPDDEIWGIHVFQFHNGSIKRLYARPDGRDDATVSIPQWFD